MRNIFFLLFLFVHCIIYSQVGFVSEINPKLKHIHAEVGSNVGVQNTEVFEYNLNLFLADMLKSSKIEVKSLSDFDFETMTNFNGFQNKKMIEYLDKFCEGKGVKKLIIFYRNHYFLQSSPYKNLFNLKFDFGILTQIGKEKTIYYMNRAQMAYYNADTKKLSLTYPKVKEESLHYEFVKHKQKEAVVDKNKNLVNSLSIQMDFIKQYEKQLIGSFSNALENLK
ncbi:hypothetical protein NZ698_19005 [Chryseobacterium sp. PBS4-4]|uniref:DUF4468 domain-containing protein n=1 Tax=Chryseobacterium edaphi TaxID=2976532 RepID=A0ABT2WB98_9FLAO|nr:hypothetical protein [Chryseobacterium edaphi]MCU7619274.1 hypothetical protein [Chryseobacterium edaphi]